jgi:hypothetical protein
MDPRVSESFGSTADLAAALSVITGLELVLIGTGLLLMRQGDRIMN